jgi:hypothetical protein
MQPLIRIPNYQPFTMNATGRLSYSTLNDLHTCERYFQLEYILEGAQREEKADFSFGHCFGEGVAHYLVHQDEEAALFTAWLAYYPQVETDKKNQAKAIALLQSAFRKLDDILQDYEVVVFDGKPATELSFKMRIDEKYYFAGHIDVVLKNKWTGKYVIFEVKTTGLMLHDLDPLYKNSGQALGYSIALDRITGEELTSYGVLYFVGQLGKDYQSTIRIFEYNKTLLDRLNWFITLGLDVKHIKEMEEIGIYPKRGQSCLRFNRPCKHFGTCNLHGFDKPAGFVEDKETYQFEYSLDDLVQDHIERLQRQPELAIPDVEDSTAPQIMDMEEI